MNSATWKAMSSADRMYGSSPYVCKLQRATYQWDKNYSTKKKKKKEKSSTDFLSKVKIMTLSFVMWPTGFSMKVSWCYLTHTKRTKESGSENELFDGTYKLVQSSVQIAGLFGELGPANVSPHRIPLHELICNLKSVIFWHVKME